MNTTTQTKERGIISRSGMGGFLNPPTHPEHNYHVMIDLKRKREDRGGMSLSAAVNTEWLDDKVKKEASNLLTNWVKPDINSPEIKDWIYNVLGYFRDCFSPDGINRSVSDNIIWIPKNRKPFGDKWQHFKRNINWHLGVMMIRQYYPEYKPSISDFKNAYWGKK